MTRVPGIDFITPTASLCCTSQSMKPRMSSGMVVVHGTDPSRSVLVLKASPVTFHYLRSLVVCV